MYLPLDQIVKSRGEAVVPERRSFGAAGDSTTRGGSTGDQRRSREDVTGRTR